MTDDPKTVNDALPPSDGWLAMIVPFPELPPLTSEQRERILDALPTVEFTLSGTWDDTEADS